LAPQLTHPDVRVGLRIGFLLTRPTGSAGLAGGLFDFNEMPLVSISDRQRAPIPNANFVATVYHGLPIDLHVA
jgi:hypothetical protein